MAKAAVDWTGDIGLADLIVIVDHVFKNADSYLELEMNGIVFRIYPNQITGGDEKERQKKFLRFVRALARLRSYGETQFALTRIGNQASIGIVGIHGMEWMPCEVNRVELPPQPPQFSIPSLDGTEERQTFSLRKIVL